MKDIEKIKNVLKELLVDYEESFREEEDDCISYPIRNVNTLSINSHLLENDNAYGVGLYIIFDKDGKFIGFEPYGDQ